jgi:D-xylose transport system permease protein
MLMVIVSGNIDLSIGAVVGLAGGIAAMTQGWGLVPCLVAAIRHRPGDRRRPGIAGRLR